jgi:type VI secretion system protein ImpK
MTVFNNIASALRRVSGLNIRTASSPRAALNRVPGFSRAMTRVDSILSSANMLGSSGASKVDTAQVSSETVSKPPSADETVRPLRADETVRPLRVDETVRPLRAGGTAEPSRLSVVVSHEAVAKSPVVRPGRNDARWENGIINAAMPILLRVSDLKQANRLVDGTVRSQLALEMRLFRDRVSKSGFSSDIVTDASYLLCTYIDEVVNDAARAVDQLPYGGDPSLLVEFHGDAWGGEDAFADLERWMVFLPVQLPLLEFYELILSFGWEGRYRVMERGPVLLNDLRSQLHALIWNERQLFALAAPVTATVLVAHKRWLTATKALGIGMLVMLALYAAWAINLNAKGRPLREALAAWEPPIRTINLAQTLPPPLPNLLSEGWINARKSPQGWLLTLRSDKAFDVGKADFRPNFREELERLGKALAPWPGDIEVVGHSDIQPINTKQFPNNLVLSQERAHNVAQELLQTSVEGGSRAPAGAMKREIHWSGKGDTEPLDPARNAAAYERNRRVEILWKVANLGPQSPRAVER